MDTLYPRCCGLDVHKKSVLACVITPKGRETRRCGTTTGQLLELADWLTAAGVTHVAMESTGVYWKPIYNLLEDEFTMLVVNAAHIKAVPGRKTDVKDAEWIAELLQHGLLRASFIPDRAQRELRELTRYRRSLVQERSREANRVQKLLEGANIKLASVATDVLGVSGRAMLTALVAGETDPDLLAALARGRLRNKSGELVEALRGLMGDHQCFMLTIQLERIAGLDAQSELQTTSPKSFLLKPMTARFSVLKNVLSGRFNARDDFWVVQVGKAVTARICTLYGDFSGRPDSCFPAFSSGAVATYLVSLSLLRNPPPSLLPLLSRFRRRSSPSTGLASIYRLHRLNKAESTILCCTAHLH